MDPNANLMEQMAIVRRLLRTHPNDDLEDGLRLADLVEALTGWLARGGFAPDWGAAYAWLASQGA